MNIQAKRIIAALIDQLIVLLGITIVGTFAILIGQAFNNGFDNYAFYMWSLYLLYNGFLVVYHALYEWGNKMTIGKKVMGLRVVVDEGEDTFKNHFIRNVLRLVDYLFIVGLVLIFIGDEKRIGDKISGLMVIEEEEYDEHKIIYK